MALTHIRIFCSVKSIWGEVKHQHCTDVEYQIMILINFKPFFIKLYYSCLKYIFLKMSNCVDTGSVYIMIYKLYSNFLSNCNFVLLMFENTQIYENCVEIDLVFNHKLWNRKIVNIVNLWLKCANF